MPYRVFISFVFAVSVTVASLYVHRYAYTDSTASNPPYRDSGFEAAPSWADGNPPALIIEATVEAFHLIVVALLIAFHPYRGVVFRRACFLFACGELLLALQMFATRLPCPDMTLYPPTQLTYSMQTIQVTLSMLLVHFYTRSRLRVLRLFYDVLCLASFYWIVSVRNLYTVDVLTGIFTEVVVFFFYHWYVRTAASIAKRPILRWFEHDALLALTVGDPSSDVAMDGGHGSPRGDTDAAAAAAGRATAGGSTATRDVELDVANSHLAFFEAAPEVKEETRASFGPPQPPAAAAAAVVATSAAVSIPTMQSSGAASRSRDTSADTAHASLDHPSAADDVGGINFWSSGVRSESRDRSRSNGFIVPSPIAAKIGGAAWGHRGAPYGSPTSMTTLDPVHSVDSPRRPLLDVYAKIDPFSSSLSFAGERERREVVVSAAEHVRTELERQFSSPNVRWAIVAALTVGCVGMGGTWALLNGIVAAGITDEYRPVGVPLPDDFLHRLIPTAPPHTPDFMLYPLVSCVFLFFVFSPHRNTYFRRLTTEYGFIMFLRFFTLLTTFLPDPSPLCATRIHALGTTCGDMIFSGHTVAFLLATLALDEWTGIWWVKAAAWSYTFCGLVAVVASKLHYSRDVLTAIVVTWGIHHLMRVGVWLRSDVVSRYRWLMVFEMDAYVHLDIDHWNTSNRIPRRIARFLRSAPVMVPEMLDVHDPME